MRRPRRVAREQCAPTFGAGGSAGERVLLESMPARKHAMIQANLIAETVLGQFVVPRQCRDNQMAPDRFTTAIESRGMSESGRSGAG